MSEKTLILDNFISESNIEGELIVLDKLGIYGIFLSVLIDLMPPFFSFLFKKKSNVYASEKNYEKIIYDLIKEKVEVKNIDVGNVLVFAILKDMIFISTGAKNYFSEREITALCLNEIYHIKRKNTLFLLDVSDYSIVIPFMFLCNVFKSNFYVGSVLSFLVFFATIIFVAPLKRKIRIDADSYTMKYGYGDEIISALKKIYRLSDPKKHNVIYRAFSKIGKLMMREPTIEKRLEKLLVSRELNESIEKKNLGMAIKFLIKSAK